MSEDQAMGPQCGLWFYWVTLTSTVTGNPGACEARLTYPLTRGEQVYLLGEDISNSTGQPVFVTGWTLLRHEVASAVGA